MIHASLDQLIFNGRTKTKLAMLAFLHCGEFVKNSILDGYLSKLSVVMDFYSRAILGLSDREIIIDTYRLSTLTIT